MLSLLFLFAFIPAFAAIPEWVKTGNNVNYPKHTFITAVGKGADLKEAEISARNAIVNEIFNSIKKSGGKIYKTDNLDFFILKSYSSSLSYNDRSTGEFYVLGTVNKNLIRMDIENEILLVERDTIYNLMALDESVSKTVQKIKEIDGILERYRHYDIMILLKQYLKGEPLVLEPLSFERERLARQRKDLFKKVSYFLKGSGFDNAKVKKFFSENGLVLLNAVPDENSEKDVITINCSKSVLKRVSREGFAYDWVADVVFADAYNSDIVINSDTSAGEEYCAVENDAKEKAGLSAESELNNMICDFLKTTL